MAIKVPSASAAADKLVQRAQAASGEYAVNAAAAGDTWATAAQAAKAAFSQGITAGDIAGRWVRGIAKAGAAKYTRKINDVGKGRFAEGVSAGKQDYTANVEPFFATVAGLTLSARQARGSAANYQRVSQVGTALNAKRLALLGAGA